MRVGWWYYFTTTTTSIIIIISTRQDPHAQNQAEVILVNGVKPTAQGLQGWNIKVEVSRKTLHQNSHDEDCMSQATVAAGRAEIKPNLKWQGGIHTRFRIGWLKEKRTTFFVMKLFQICKDMYICIQSLHQYFSNPILQVLQLRNANPHCNLATQIQHGHVLWSSPCYQAMQQPYHLRIVPTPDAQNQQRGTASETKWSAQKLGRLFHSSEFIF